MIKKSKPKLFEQKSKMRNYKQIFDEDVKQMRCGFFDKELYKLGFKTNKDDIFWAVEAGYEYRTDLISKKFYGTAKYDWVIEDLNNIKDPIKDLKIGKKLKLMSQSRIINFS